MKVALRKIVETYNEVWKVFQSLFCFHTMYITVKSNTLHALHYIYPNSLLRPVNIEYLQIYFLLFFIIDLISSTVLSPSRDP